MVPALFPVLPVPDRPQGVELPPALTGEVGGECGGAGWGSGVPLEMGKSVGRSGCILGTWARSNIKLDSFKGGKRKLPSHVKGAGVRRVMPAVGRGRRGPLAGGCRGPPVPGSSDGRVGVLCLGSKSLWDYQASGRCCWSCPLPRNAVESPLGVLTSASEGIKKCCLSGIFCLADHSRPCCEDPLLWSAWRCSGKSSSPGQRSR